ncbi:MAG: hypothetical protein A2831_02410 [Candidatus Yanofskybacteria bacterium RIFCSPHIGHO2_01_FULL_44_17]|uniref:Toxin YoeB n=1 Tax=Candidatus Yanofskybacteria bacterium RIFCSPHIGHO2_01_FULL_44_17 TaxID=1802668 RepID=A0A1F8EV43_9BACT|nr:MAG: hypothetical protein A2831_02410 [Candidatus Yanofskybacteria bacterium RIFCSPHIGHO2_01_FULL_44_17]
MPTVIKRKAEKQEKLFRENPYHPSLRTEKLEPQGRQMWSLRVDRKHRIIFRFIDKNNVLFLTIGPHDWIYKINF